MSRAFAITRAPWPMRSRRNEIGFDREMKELARVRASDALKPMIEQGVPA